MATPEIIAALTDVVQACLEDKLKAGFDANAALTIEIAREVAGAVEDKANEYTDVEISNLMTLITGGEVDLGPFTEFMNSVKVLLDGDENTEGYQIFNTLITDTAVNKQTLINHTTSIQLIQQSLSTFQSTISDHATRIAALEAAAHDAPDCEECHDDILNLVKDSIADACTSSTVALDSYRSARGSSILAAWRMELQSFAVNIISKAMNVLTGVATSCWWVNDVTLPGDFEVSVKFAISDPYARANMMLFGGDYEDDLYCRVEQSDRSIRVWMDSVDDLDFIKFTPVETNVYDGKMHTFKLLRVGDKMQAWIGNEYLGEQPAYMYTGTNAMAVGMHRAHNAAGLPFDGIIDGFNIKDASGATVVDLSTGLNMVAQPELTTETFASIENGINTHWYSISSDRSFREYVGEGNGAMNVVMIGASILEQSFFAESDAVNRFIKHGRLANVFNRATSGDTSAGLLTALPAYLEEFKGQETNTLFVLHVGGNDISQGGGYPGNAGTLEANYIAIINAIHAAGFQVAPSSITYRIPPASNPSEPYNLNVVIPQIKLLCPDWINGETPVIDLYQETQANQATWFEGDNIHPNGFGEASIREYIAEKVAGKLALDQEASPSIAADSVHAHNVIVNFGEDNFMLGKQNNATLNGLYESKFLNLDYSPASGFGFALGFSGNSNAEGIIYGSQELSIHNQNVNRTSVWFDAAVVGSMTFNEGSFKANEKYTVRMTGARLSADDRFTKVTVGEASQVTQTNLSPVNVLEFKGVTAEALMAHGVKFEATNGSDYGYCSGIQFELEVPPVE